MESIISWCNENQGFISAILAALSLLVSVLAIIISVKVAKLPYKKKLAISFFTNIGVGGLSGTNFYSIEALNIGNRAVKVDFVGIGFYKGFRMKKAINIHQPFEPKLLSVNEMCNATYSTDQIEDCKKNSRVLYAIAYDAEHKLYKKRIKY